MDEKTLRSFCKRLHIVLDAAKKNSAWLSGRCPLAFKTHKNGHDNNPSFGVSIHDKGASAFKCFTCGHKGSFSKLVLMLARARGVDYKGIVHEIETREEAGLLNFEIPDWDTIEKEIPYEEDYDQKEEEYCTKYERAIGHPYLRKRGIGWKTTRKLNLRFDRLQDRILFPIYDSEWRFRGCTGRYCGQISDSARETPKVRDYPGLRKREFFLGECFARSLSRRGNYVILVEGLFDYARVHEAGCQAVLALLGSEVTREKIDKLLDFDRPIIWMVDNDQAGRSILHGKIDPETGRHDNSTGILHTLYGLVPQHIVKYPKGIKDPGDCTDSQIHHMIDNAKLFIK
jgi:DNA primase